MRKFIDTEQKKLKDILSDDVNYEIPKFQREFSWEDDHVEQFWNDLDEHFELQDKTAYFFGTIVLIAGDQSGEYYKIVDGQQRLTTSLVLLAVIRDMLQELGSNLDADRIHSFLETDDPLTPEYPYRLRLSRNNEDFFQEHVLVSGSASVKAKLDSNKISKRNKNLFNAYRILYEKLEEKLKNIPGNENKTKTLVEIANDFVKYFVVVRNIVDTPDRAYRIFDSINNRGIRLNESDLVKNYLLETIDHGKGDVELWHSKWLDLLQKLDIVSLKEDLFLRHFLMAHYQPTGPKEVFERVNKKIKTTEQVENFIDSLICGADAYGKLKKPELSDWYNDQKIVDDLEAFNSLNAKVIYPVLLKGYELFAKSKKEFAELVETLLIFFFRSRTICTTSATALENLMNRICKEMRENTKTTVKDIKKMLRDSDEYPSDPEFEFNFSIFDATPSNALYILINLNEELHGGRKQMTLSAVKNNVSIEHIMPKTIDGTPWEEYLEKTLKLKNPAEKDDYHQNSLWRIGNLTILNKSKNFKAQNKSYLEKLNEAYKTDQAKITTMLEQWPEWNKETIEDRQKILAKTAKKIWEIEV